MFQLQKYLLFGSAASILFQVIMEIGMWIRNERITWFHRAMGFMLGLYLTVVFSITASPGSAISTLNFWGNSTLFLPLGIFLVLLFNHCQRLFITLLIGAATSFFIELAQLFGGRSTNVGDIILNIAGTFFGYLIGRAILCFAPSLRKKVGIFKREDGKLKRKRHDAGSFAFLSVFILASVFLTGYAKTADKLQAPVIPEESSSLSDSVITNDSLQAPAISEESLFLSEQPPEVQVPKRISVEIDGKNAYLWEIGSNAVLFEKESEEPVAPASTAKMLTALTALEYCEESNRVTVGNEVQLIAEDASRAWLYPGNELTVRQLLDALLLPSGNDAAYAIAAFAGRKICRDDTVSLDKALAAFMKALNEKAVEIGAFHSHFVVPDGYDTDGQFTTAQDLALIAGEFLKSDILREISGSCRISDVWLSGQHATYDNTNELINPQSPYYYECAAGLKTGRSDDAGCCLISCAYIEDKLYVCVVMGSTEEGRWQDSIKLYHAIAQ